MKRSTKSGGLTPVGMILPDADIADDLPPKIRPGLYDFVFASYQTALMFKGRAPKLIINFKIADPTNEAFESVLPRYYNVRKLIGPAGKGGRFQASPKGDFAREFFRLFPGDGRRLDRIPMSKFKGAMIEGRVKTVDEVNGDAIPGQLQYSVIAELRKVLR